MKKCYKVLIFEVVKIFLKYVAPALLGWLEGSEHLISQLL